MSLRNVESDMSHRHRPQHKEALFSHVGIQHLTKEAVCIIYGSALRGPPNKRLSVSKCSRGGSDLMHSATFNHPERLIAVFSQFPRVSVDVFVWEALCNSWLLWMNVQRSHDCRDTGITHKPLGGSYFFNYIVTG